MIIYHKLIRYVYQDGEQACEECESGRNCCVGTHDGTDDNADMCFQV